MGLLGPSSLKCPGSVPESVPENKGVRGSVPQSMVGGALEVRAPGSEVPKSAEKSLETLEHKDAESDSESRTPEGGHIEAGRSDVKFWRI